MGCRRSGTACLIVYVDQRRLGGGGRWKGFRKTSLTQTYPIRTNTSSVEINQCSVVRHTVGTYVCAFSARGSFVVDVGLIQKLIICWPFVYNRS